TAKTTTSNDRQNNGVHHLKHNAYTISNDRKHNHTTKITTLTISAVTATGSVTVHDPDPSCNTANLQEEGNKNSGERCPG
ncbi:hypothetical protein KUCAC02_033006, partial [Chaenocephalus aceratus]